MLSLPSPLVAGTGAAPRRVVRGLPCGFLSVVLSHVGCHPGTRGPFRFAGTRGDSAAVRSSPALRAAPVPAAPPLRPQRGDRDRWSCAVSLLGWARPWAEATEGSLCSLPICRGSFSAARLPVSAHRDSTCFSYFAGFFFFPSTRDISVPVTPSWFEAKVPRRLNKYFEVSECSRNAASSPSRAKPSSYLG